MDYLVIFGHTNIDIEPAKLIFNKLRAYNQQVELLSDNQYISNPRKNRFIIAVGGPRVNKLSEQIQKDYLVINTSNYPGMENASYFFGSLAKQMANNFNLAPCLSIWGDREVDTINSVTAFLLDGGFFNELIQHPENWEKNYEYNNSQVLSENQPTDPNQYSLNYGDPEERDFSHYPEHIRDKFSASSKIEKQSFLSRIKKYFWS